MSLILSAHQPAYLPWLGYFDKILRAEIFVFLDHVQFEKNSFINRNQIKTPSGPAWLTVPVLSKGHMKSSIAETRVDEQQPWRSKHLKTLSHNYARAPCFEERFIRLQALYAVPGHSIADICWNQLRFWLDEVGCKTRMVRSSTLRIAARKSDLILDLCRHFGATHYISGALGKDYLEEGVFKQAGVDIEYQEFCPPDYQQLHGEFIPNLSIVDAWMNVDDVRGLVSECGKARRVA